MKCIAALAAAMIGFSVPAYAENPAEDFKSLIRHVGSNWNIDGMWLALLPVIKDDCNLKINRAVLQLTINQTERPDLAIIESQHIASGSLQNRLETDWRGLRDISADGACDMAVGLWGEDGAIFPGILEKAQP